MTLRWNYHIICIPQKKIKMMNVKQLILPLCLCLSATVIHAKPEQFYKPYVSTELVENVQPKQYVIKSLNLSLSSKIDAPDFLNQEQIKARYLEKLNEELKARNMLATEQTKQPIYINFDIQQTRVFAGEGLKFISSKVVGKYAHSTLQYSSTLNLANVELAKLSVGEQVSLGKKGSLGKIARDLSGSGKPENELEDIDGFAQFMIEKLPK